MEDPLMYSLTMKERVDICLKAMGNGPHSAICDEFNHKNPDKAITTTFVNNLRRQFLQTGHVWNNTEIEESLKEEPKKTKAKKAK